jgi:transposase
MNRLIDETDRQSDTRVRGTKRLKLVSQGLAAGMSQRGIAKELGVDEGTIRRDIKILTLPEPSLAAIRNGAPAEKHLCAARKHAAALQLAAVKEAANQSSARRLAEEKATGLHSDALATLLLGWLRKNMARPFAEQVLNEIGPANSKTGDQPTLPSNKPHQTLAFCTREELKNSSPDEIELASYASALLKALPLIAPEWAIRCRAIEKARRIVESPSRY